MPVRFSLKLPATFSFRHTVFSHGWHDLSPFRSDEAAERLRYVFAPSGEGPALSVDIRNSAGKLLVTASGAEGGLGRLKSGIRHMLRLDDDLDEFYSVVRNDGRLCWIAEESAGRLLRSPTVWEDLVKTICTTNCSWSLTKKIVANLVDALGEPADDGSRAFPTPQAMAALGPEFYRNEIRAGYRSAYLAELAATVASGRLDPETWLSSDLPTAELKNEIKAVKGVGDYAAENLLKLLGRYDGLALDSWLRSRYFEVHNRGRRCADKKIARSYENFGRWKGLALWCDMTESWFR